MNTADSRVELSFDVAASPSLSPALRRLALARLGPRLRDGVLTVVASEHRSQWANRSAAAQRLADILRGATAPPPRPRRPTVPGPGARERRLAGKRRRGDVKRHRGRPDPNDPTA